MSNRFLRAFWHDQAGFILSAELVLILTVGVLAMVVGIHAIAKSVNHELVDVAQSFGAFNQSFHFNGFKGCKACVIGSEFNDGEDQCDCATLIHTPPKSVKVQGNGHEGSSSGGGGHNW